MSNIEKELLNLKKKIEALEKIINGSKNSLFGKPSSELGSTSSDTVIRTLGTLKVRYGSKYVTIFKDGKLSIDESNKFIYLTNAVGSKDGIYIIQQEGSEDFSIYIVSKGKQYQIASSALTYVSYLESQTTTSELKETALRNLGMVYTTVDDFNNDQGVSNGIIYISSENKIYLSNNGGLREFKLEIPKTFEELTIYNLITDNIKIGDISVNSYGINSDTNISINGSVFKNKEIETDVIVCNNYSSNDEGFYIKNEDGKWVLKIDKIIGTAILPKKPLYHPYDIISEVSDTEFKTLYSLFNKDCINGDVIAVSFDKELTIYKADYNRTKDTPTSYTGNDFDPDDSTNETTVIFGNEVNDLSSYETLFVTGLGFNLKTDSQNNPTEPHELEYKQDGISLDLEQLYIKVITSPKKIEILTTSTDRTSTSYVTSYKEYYYTYMELYKNNSDQTLETDTDTITEPELLKTSTYEYSSRYTISLESAELYDSNNPDHNLKLYDIKGNLFNIYVEEQQRVSDYTISEVISPNLVYLTYEDDVFTTNDEEFDYNSLFGGFIYPIKIKGELHPLFEINNDFRLFVPQVTTEDGTITVNLSNNIVTIGHNDNKTALGLTLQGKQEDTSSLTEPFFARYSDDSDEIPQNCNNKTLVTKEWVTKYSTVPTGMIVPFYGDTIPDGWVLCDGQTYTINGTSITTPNLINKILVGQNTDYSDDYYNTFKVDDLSGINSSSPITLYPLKYIMKV